MSRVWEDLRNEGQIPWPSGILSVDRGQIWADDQSVEDSDAGVGIDFPQGACRVAEAKARLRARPCHSHHRASAGGKKARAVIVVCGEALIDMVLSVNGTRRPAPGGGPFNTARALARLGVPTAFLGHFSEDQLGRLLADRLAADGASLALASFGPEPTTVAVANIDKDGLVEYEFVIKGTSAPNLTREMVPRALPPDVSALHLGTLGLVLQPMASSLTELVERENGTRLVMLDPNIPPVLATDPEYRLRLHSLISKSTIVKASAEDLAWLYPDIDYRAAAGRSLEAGVSLVLVTLGAAGGEGAGRQAPLAAPAGPVGGVGAHRGRRAGEGERG